MTIQTRGEKTYKVLEGCFYWETLVTSILTFIATGFACYYVMKGADPHKAQYHLHLLQLTSYLYFQAIALYVGTHKTRLRLYPPQEKEKPRYNEFWVVLWIVAAIVVNAFYLIHALSNTNNHEESFDLFWQVLIISGVVSLLFVGGEVAKILGRLFFDKIPEPPK